MGGSAEVYTSSKQRRKFSYANVRKASYRGNKIVYINILIVLTINMLPVFKFCVIWGIFLTWFADSLLFDMMIKTSYEDGVDSLQDLIERNMILGDIGLMKIIEGDIIYSSSSPHKTASL